MSGGLGEDGERSSKYGSADTKPDLRSSSGLVVMLWRVGGCVRIGMMGLRAGAM